MIRTLVLIAVVSFVLAIGCFAGAFVIAGGPFVLNDGWRFHHVYWRVGGAERPARSTTFQPASSIREEKAGWKPALLTFEN